MKKQTNLGAGESLELKTRLLLHKALYSIGSFTAFASALVPKTYSFKLTALQLCNSLYPAKYFSFFWEGNNKTHGTEIHQKKKSNTKLWKKEIAKLNSAQVHMPQKIKTSFRCKSLLTHNI